MSATGDRGQGAGQAGFTLIECLAVLSITALAGAIAFPGLERAVSGAWLAESKQALAADLRQARGRALASGQYQALTVSADGGAWGWNGRADHRLPLALRVSADASGSPAFYPDGSAAPGVVILSAGARRTAVGVSNIGVVSLSVAR
ncbi:MAG TPA: prepilin-type N-terminal cleavage/methylation domain-containing protein [Caulobacteraceae bacterium]|jgi:general secretion pathway protein H|nr:prepilin-type N-terminal cleavage/methylation domain-containing protein [Caulobacteraceae bacterium]